MARPELRDTRPAGAVAGRTRPPCSWSRSREWTRLDLLRELLEHGGARRGHRGAHPRVAEGNPLFVDELVASTSTMTSCPLRGDGGARPMKRAIVVPPTIQALLAARLDRLTDPFARAVIEAAAVEGKEFGRERLRSARRGRRWRAAADACRHLPHPTVRARATARSAFVTSSSATAAYDGILEGAARASSTSCSPYWLEQAPRRRFRPSTSCSDTTSSLPSSCGASSAPI